MKVIKEFLLALYGQIRTKVQEVQTLDEWRNQVALLKQENYKDYPIQYPALFLQILPIDWTEYQNGTQQGDCTIRVHIVQENYTMSQSDAEEMEAHLSRYDLSQKVHEALAGFQGEMFVKLKRSSSALDEEPTDIISDTIDFETTLTDETEKIAENTRYVFVNPDLIPQKTKYLDNG